jgi:uncharacterized protein YjbI with pentapeptide repeats
MQRRRGAVSLIRGFVLLVALVVLGVFTFRASEWFQQWIPYIQRRIPRIIATTETKPLFLAFLVVVAGGGLLYLLGRLSWFFRENAQTIFQSLTTFAAVAALYFTAQTVLVSREEQVTERFTKAIEQLGKREDEDLVLRLGGIHALERIAKDSKTDHWPVMQVLTAYARKYAFRKELKNPWQCQYEPKEKWVCHGEAKEEEARDIIAPLAHIHPDRQAILSVIAHRTKAYDNHDGERLNLSRTDLRGSTLPKFDLQKLDLRFTDLRCGNLIGAQLQEAALRCADLRDSNMQGGVLHGANLEEANLHGAYLRGIDLRRARYNHKTIWPSGFDYQKSGAIGPDADLERVDLRGVDLWGAELHGANLQGANLQGVRNLTVEQLATVKTLYQATLDPPLREAIQQQYPLLLEKPP